jgi:hypothetical protein
MPRRRQPPGKTHDLRATDVPGPISTAEATIIDPYGDRGVALISVRDDYLAWLWARGRIEEHEYRAARRWQRAFEIVEAGLASGFDPTRPVVDCARPSEPLTEARLRAFALLDEAKRCLGIEGDALMADVCGRGLALIEVAKRRGLYSRRARNYLGRRFRECLDTLSRLWGMRPLPGKGK